MNGCPRASVSSEIPRAGQNPAYRPPGTYRTQHSVHLDSCTIRRKMSRGPRFAGPGRTAMNRAQKVLSAIAGNNRIALLCGTAIVALGMGLSSLALANGLVEMKRADREVTVRGVAQRDVAANRASWGVQYSE